MTPLRLFDDRQFYKNLLVLAIPIILQSFANTLVGALATVMIGRIGTLEVAAVGLGNQLFFLFDLCLFGIGSGGAIFTAQFWGRKDISGIRKNMGFCLTLGLTAAFIFTMISVLFPGGFIGLYSRDKDVIKAGAAYIRSISPSFIPYSISVVFIMTLRSVEKVRLGFIATVIFLVLNTVLNYIFIFGAGPVPCMGIEGAGRATSIARLVQAVILVMTAYIRRYTPAGSFRELTAFNAYYAGQFFRFTVPVMANEILWALGVTVHNVIFARTSTDAIAAYNITTTVWNLVWVFVSGIGNAVGILVGKKIGENDEAKAREYAARSVYFTPLLSIGTALVLFFLSRMLPFIFNVNPVTTLYASQMLAILCCVFPFRAFNNTMIIGICRAGGDTVFSAIYDVSIMWIFSIPLAVLAAFAFGAPVWVIYLCLASEYLLKTILGFWRFKSGKWLHNVTTGL